MLEHNAFHYTNQYSLWNRTSQVSHYAFLLSKKLAKKPKVELYSSMKRKKLPAWKWTPHRHENNGVVRSNSCKPYNLCIRKQKIRFHSRKKLKGSLPRHCGNKFVKIKSNFEIAICLDFWNLIMEIACRIRIFSLNWKMIQRYFSIHGYERKMMYSYSVKKWFVPFYVKLIDMYNDISFFLL